MSVKVSQMTVDELREIIGVVVEEKLQALLIDDEVDLELIEKLKARLFRQNEEVKNGERGLALEDVVSRLGLN